jgi:uncharacterized membrane protein
MKELMTHVERIIRPVRALQSRKLRMRHELLAHLQSAFDEESAYGSSEAMSIRQAVARLGNPTELTKELQRTVPWAERVLLARIPVSHTIERWEEQGARKLYGVGAITLLHISILSGVAGLLSGIPSYMVESVKHSLTHSTVAPAHPGLFFVGILLVWQAIFVVSCRFVMAAADPHKRPTPIPTLRRAGAVIALQIVFVIVATAAALDRLPTFAEIIGNIAVTVMLLVCSILVARWVASRRRPYDEWLTLDLAG